MATQQPLQRGVSLLEVLAAIFVLSVGLLGVLAVIPFGAFQVSQARHAEYASNMLANAAEEIFIRKMAAPMEWTAVDATEVWSNGIPIFDRVMETLNCTKFIWYEPFEVFDPDLHIFCVSTFITAKHWDEVMRGYDDLNYEFDGGDRPVLRFKNGKPIGSGKYTWFFTYLPEIDSAFIGDKNAVPLAEVEPKVVADILACYNRVATDDRQVAPSSFTASRGGGTFTLPNAEHLELLTQTKYVFVTWGPAIEVEGGAWCKIVFVDKSNPAIPKVVVTGDLEGIGNNIQMYIPSGVLYHKRVKDVPIWE